MVPTTLPTYVSKAAAVRRTVQTIDLDSTGVWSSGRNGRGLALAREAEESDRAARPSRRATRLRLLTGRRWPSMATVTCPESRAVPVPVE